jgi:hypothetical protein
MRCADHGDVGFGPALGRQGSTKRVKRGAHVEHVSSCFGCKVGNVGNVGIPLSIKLHQTLDLEPAQRPFRMGVVLMPIVLARVD